MSVVEHTIEVDVPVRVAYDQWTQFEEFPQFMEGVKRIVQKDDKTLEWTAEIAGKEKVWTAEIVEQTPDQRVAWRSTSGAPNSGVVTFQPSRCQFHEGNAAPRGTTRGCRREGR